MRATLLLVCCSLFACRTSSLGACNKDNDCPANSVCSSNGQVCIAAACSPVCGSGQVCSHGACVASGGPAITGIAITTPAHPDFTSSVTGRGYYAGAPTVTTPLTITATIAASAGIDASTVCLRVTGETGACAHPGTAGASNTYTFGLPRPSAQMDGTTPLTFTITAADSLYATSSGSAQAGHITTTDPQPVYFDTTPPTIAVASDATPYARTGGAITVNAIISDATGVSSAYLLSGGATIDAGFVDGGFFQFPLDPTAATPGAEGTYAFMVVANDGVGNPGDAGATRFIDDAPPDASVRVFSGADLGTSGVTYPTAVANTGYTGSSFIYSDTVHVKGTLTDLGGIGAATLHVDGIELDGGVTTGVAQSLGCTLGAPSCSFDAQVALNAPQNGAFHTGAAMSDAGVPAGEAIPSGNLQLTITAQDQAKAGDGVTPAPNIRSNGTAAQVNRLLWQQTLASGNVTGIAVHPSGDVIATSSSAATGDSVYDLAPDQPLVRWSFGSGVGLGPVPGPPAVGAGNGGTAAIYFASTGGFIDALAADGGVIFQADAGGAAAFGVGPAVDSAAWTDGGTAEQAVAPDNNGASATSMRLWAASSPNSAAPFSVQSDDVDTFSSPMVFKGFVWFGDGVDHVSGNVTRHPFKANGTLGPAAVVTGLQARPYWGLITDGTTVFAATVRPTNTTLLDMYSITPAFAMGWDTTAAHLAAEPTIGIDGNLLASDRSPAHTVSKVATLTGVFTTLLALGASSTANTNPIGYVPLQGSDGHVYLPVTISASAASVLALVGGQLSWQLLLPSAALVRAAAMDCNGRLFVGDGSTVYALITDDHGLADTKWPNQRRDARNTGNAAAPKYGIRTVSGCIQ